MPSTSDYIQPVDLPECKHFLAAMRKSKVVMHVHPLETEENKREVHELIRPCVEGFYGRDDFDLSMLLGGTADPYFAVTLAEGAAEPRNVVGCMLGYWHASPTNTVEIRFEATRSEDDSSLLLHAMKWAVLYMARNDPFIKANLAGEQAVTVRACLSTDDSPAVWTADMLYAECFAAPHRGAGGDDDEIVLEKELSLAPPRAD
jgi:hypothetical protein